MTNITFVPVFKDQLFYNRWQYCTGFYLNEATALRDLDHTMIDKRIAWIKDHREMYSRHSSQLAHWGINLNWDRGSAFRKITQETIDKLHEVCEIIRSSSQEFKLVVSANQAWVYTNSVDLPNLLNNVDSLKWLRFTEAVVNRQRNTILLKNPKYTHRSYLKALKLPDVVKVQLLQFLSSQDDVEISPSLARWFNGPYARMQDYYYINHTGDSLLTMLNLIHPGLIRKTSEIISS